MQHNRIEHQGIVESTENNHIVVNILSKSACASCAVKGACSMSEVEEKKIDVYQPETTFQTGEHVKVFYAQKLGLKAVFIGYVLPFVILLITLIISSLITENEPISGIISLAVLVPYYLIIYFKRNNLKRTFSFEIEKLNC